MSHMTYITFATRLPTCCASTLTFNERRVQPSGSNLLPLIGVNRRRRKKRRRTRSDTYKVVATLLAF